MNKYFLIILMSVLVAFESFTQTKERITQLESEISDAVANGDYELAATLNKEKKYLEEIEKALKMEDFEEAARLKKEMLNSLNSPNITVDESKKNTAEFDFEFYDKIYAVNEDETTLQLESINSKTGSRTFAGYGYASSVTFSYIPGFYSKNQLSNENQWSFYVRVMSDVDPSVLYKMVSLEIDEYKGNFSRKYISNEFKSIMYGGSSKAVTENEVPLRFERVNEEVFQIFIDTLINPGEYAFVQGDLWHVVGIRDLMSFSPEINIPNPIPPINIYSNNSKYPKFTYLGVDYSLCKIKSDKYIGRDDELRNHWDQASKDFYESFMDVGRIEDYYNKHRRVLFYPGVMRVLAKDILPNNFMIASSDAYQLSQKEIEDHIASYKVNYPGLSLVIVPELYDMDENRNKGFVIIFDNRTKKIVDSFYTTPKSCLTKAFKVSDFEVCYTHILRIYTDERYKPTYNKKKKNNEIEE